METQSPALKAAEEQLKILSAKIAALPSDGSMQAYERTLMKKISGIEKDVEKLRRWEGWAAK